MKGSETGSTFLFRKLILLLLRFWTFQERPIKASVPTEASQPFMNDLGTAENITYCNTPSSHRESSSIHVYFSVSH